MLGMLGPRHWSTQWARVYCWLTLLVAQTLPETTGIGDPTVSQWTPTLGGDHTAILDLIGASQVVRPLYVRPPHQHCDPMRRDSTGRVVVCPGCIPLNR
jgi:hypothetical protein